MEREGLQGLFIVLPTYETFKLTVPPGSDIVELREAVSVTLSRIFSPHVFLRSLKRELAASPIADFSGFYCSFGVCTLGNRKFSNDEKAYTLKSLLFKQHHLSADTWTVCV
jgi:hypothetical protein